MHIHGSDKTLIEDDDGNNDSDSDKLFDNDFDDENDNDNNADEYDNSDYREDGDKNEHALDFEEEEEDGDGEIGDVSQNVLEELIDKENIEPVLHILDRKGNRHRAFAITDNRAKISVTFFHSTAIT